MRYSKWLGVFAFILIAFISFQPWVYIASKDIVVTGLRSAGTNFGKPGLLNLIIGGIAVIFFLVPTVIAKRANLFFCAFDMAWAIRNFIILSSCRAGECPEKKLGLYMLIAAAVLMVVAALFPDLPLKDRERESVIDGQ